jgi:phosphatidylglycerophosphatase A
MAAKKPSYAIPAQVWQHPAYFIAFGFGIGTVPIAPGTFGTLLAIPFYLVLSALPLSIYLIFTLGFCLASMWLCQFVSKQIAVEDHPGMCIDEFAGFFVTMINAPVGVTWVVLGFLFFRLFDIFKPFPINVVDKNIHGGFGMVLDDVIAGFFSFCLLQIIFTLSQHF